MGKENAAEGRNRYDSGLSGKRMRLVLYGFHNLPLLLRKLALVIIIVNKNIAVTVFKYR